MNFSDFIKDSTCPVCGKKLTLFLRARRHSLWKADPTRPSGYVFSQHLVKNAKLNEKDQFVIDLEGEYSSINANSFSLAQEIQNWEFFLFFLCNEKAIVKEFNEYKIQSHDACYVCNSAFFKLKAFVTGEGITTRTRWGLVAVNPD